MIKNDQNVIKNDQKRSKTIKNDQKRSKTIKNDQNISFLKINNFFRKY
jgi:hypothetical protein